MQRFSKAILALEGVIAATGKALSWLLVPLMLIMVFEIVTRRVLNHPTVWTFETSTQLFGIHFMLLAAYTLLLDRHISVDIIVSRFSKRTRAKLDVFLYLIFFFPFMIVLLIEGTAFAAESWKVLESSSTVFAPPVYPIKTVIPLTALMVLLQGFCIFYKKICFLLRGTEI